MTRPTDFANGPTRIAPRRATPKEQQDRLTQLSEIRIKRPLTSAERKEEEELERRLYMRVHIEKEREAEKRTTSRLFIGSAAAMAKDPLDAEVANVSVRLDDRPAFLGVIAAREQLANRKVETLFEPDRRAARLAEEAANCALDAAVGLSDEDPDIEQTRARLALAAATAIAALAAMPGTK